jgi:DNA-binding NarL/FixJ family response regulator
MIRCLIVDDSASFLEAATRLLEREGLSIVGLARTSEEALRRADELQPDVILVDVGLGAESGLDLARRLGTDGVRATVILVSTHAEADYADLIWLTPAAGFVSKAQLSAEAIRRFVSEPRET